MRLVDIDKHFELNEAFYKSDVKMSLHTVKAALENAPIVDAIPIDWLRMWFIKKASLIGVTLMSEIESDWEKENENV